MKILLIYFFLMMNSFLMLIFLMNLFLFKIPSNPMNQLINLIFFTIFMSLNLFSIKPSSLLYIYMILIIMISGMMILFSYFICLINIYKMKKIKFKFFYFIIYFMIYFMMLMSMKINFQIFMKKIIIFNNNYFLNSLMKLFYFPNLMIFLIIILFLILMLIISSKICFNKKKSLRNKL